MAINKWSLQGCSYLKARTVSKHVSRSTCVPEGLLYKSKTHGNDIFIIKPSQPAFKSSWVSGKKKWNLWLLGAWLHSWSGTERQPIGFSSVVRKWKWPWQAVSWKIVEIQKFCLHGSNVMFLLSSRGEWQRVLLTEVNALKTHCCQAFENISISRAIRAAEYLKIFFCLAV